MKKTGDRKPAKMVALAAALALVLALGACSGGGGVSSTASVASRPPASSAPAVEADVVLYADRSAGLPFETVEELGLIETKEVKIKGAVTVEALADALSEWTGLDFTPNGVEVSGDDITIDWAVDSVMLGGDGEPKEDFFFFDAVTQNWFMLDSLARTVHNNIMGSTVYYSQNGGQPMGFEEMEGLEELPVDQPYYGSSYFALGSVVINPFTHYSYADSENGLVLHYTDAFESLGYVDADGNMAFPLIEDSRTTLRYWVIPNTYEETAAELIDSLAVDDAVELDGNQVVAYGRFMDQLTGEWTDHALYYFVGQGWIAVVSIDCQSLDEASDWYSQIQAGAVYVEVAAS